MEELGHEIEALILQNFSRQDELVERVRHIEGRMSRTEEDVVATDDPS